MPAVFSGNKKKLKETKKFIVHSPLRGFSAIQDKGTMHYKGFSEIYIYLKRVKNPLSFRLKFLWYNKMLKPTKRSQGSRNFYNNICVRFFFNIPMILT